jgi:hypothetical protein
MHACYEPWEKVRRADVWSESAQSVKSVDKNVRGNISGIAAGVLS